MTLEESKSLFDKIYERAQSGTLEEPMEVSLEEAQEISDWYATANESNGWFNVTKQRSAMDSMGSGEAQFMGRTVIIK